MAERLQELLEKINNEGIKQAETRAKEIETEAQQKAQKMIEAAQAEAQRIVTQAQTTAKNMKESTETALKQASRNVILSLKDEIRKIFNNILLDKVKKSLAPDEISSMLGALIKGYVKEGGKIADIKVLLKPEDLEKLKDTFVAKLQNDLKDGIEFKKSSNINTGFAVSFDKGKSFFDFTDEAVAEALSAYFNPELKKILK